MKIIATSLQETIVIAENIDERICDPLIHLWNEYMYWSGKHEYHLFIANDEWGIPK